MKLIYTLIICLLTTGVFAQTTENQPARSTADTVKLDTIKVKRKRIRFGFGDDVAQVNVNQRDTDYYTASKAPGWSFGLTFTRFDIGLTTLRDNGSFTLSPANQFLNYRSWRSSNIGFDVLQLGYRFSSSFRIYASGGFDWTNLRLRESVTILRDQPTLAYQFDGVAYDKNRLSATYVRIPLSFDFRTHDDADGRRFHFVGGPDIGLLLGSSLKQESKQNGDLKLGGNYHFAKVRYGAFARVGYGAIGVFAKYYFNDMFENSPLQKGLKQFNFGMSVGW